MILNKWRDDLLAGLTGAVTGAPQAMGFAIIAGVSPLYGLYSAFVATIITALLASSVLLTVAPTNALMLVVGTALIDYEPEQHLRVVFMLTILVGIFMLLIGVLRLGSLTRFVSNAVLTGFITGAGALIMLGQLRHLTGYEGAGNSIPLLRFWDWLTHLSHGTVHTTLVGLVTGTIIVSIKQTKFKNAATMTAIIIATIWVTVAGWQDVPIVRDISPIPNGLPPFAMPDFSLAPGLISTALAIAILASVQSAALVQAVPNPNGRSDIARDFNAMGIANIVGGLFQGLPTCASLSRTVINVESGAQTRLANLIAGVLIGFVLLIFGKGIELIPLTALAAHLIVAASSLINFEDIRLAWRVRPSARVLMLVTFATTMLFPLQYSIYVGVGLSLAMYIYSSAETIRVVQLSPTGDGHFRRNAMPHRLPDNDVIILSISGNLFFAAVYHLEEMLPDPAGSKNTVVIIRIRENLYLGGTGIHWLLDYAEKLEAVGGRLMITGVDPSIYDQLSRTNAVNLLGEENIFEAGDVVFSSTERALEQGYAWLAEKSDIEPDPELANV